MKVRFRTTVSDGAGRRFVSGQVADVDDKQAKVWLGHGLVESAESEKREATTRAPRTTESGSGDASTATKPPRKRTAKKASAKKKS